MTWVPDRLYEAAGRIAAGEKVSVTVRELLSWFVCQRRTYWNVRIMRSALEAKQLVTQPNFEYVSLDSNVRILPAPDVATVQSPNGSPTGALTPLAQPVLDGGATTAGDDGTKPATDATAPSGIGTSDPTFRIGRLASAGRTPTYVAPGASLSEVITTMLIHDYSQLPVMTSLRDVKGMVSWRSVGVRLALGKSAVTAKDCMEPACEIQYDEPLFKAVDVVTTNEYVLVRNERREVAGIVTTADLSLTFNQLGEQFLLLGEIENHIRAILDKKFTVEQLHQCFDSADTDRKVEDVSDLTFGEYIRLLENEERWDGLKIKIDRVLFVKELDKVRLIRNDVMHFDPDGISAEEVETLRKFARFLQGLMEFTPA
jgi:CBS domain-containing protein